MVHTTKYGITQRIFILFSTLIIFMVGVSAVSTIKAADNALPISYRATNYNHLPSITAVLNRYNLREKTIVQSSWIVLSPHGMHVSVSEGSPEVIKNFETKKLWMIDRKRKMYYALEVDKYLKEFPELAANLFSTASASNLIGQTACEGWFGELKGERTWRGQIVQEWHCSDEQQVLVNKQYFSAEHGLVVRVEGANLSVDELTDIKTRSDENKYIYGPPESFYSASKEQFVSGKVKLNTYKNP